MKNIEINTKIKKISYFLKNKRLFSIEDIANTLLDKNCCGDSTLFVLDKYNRQFSKSEDNCIIRWDKKLVYEYPDLSKGEGYKLSIYIINAKHRRLLRADPMDLLVITDNLHFTKPIYRDTLYKNSSYNIGLSSSKREIIKELKTFFGDVKFRIARIRQDGSYTYE